MTSVEAVARLLLAHEYRSLKRNDAFAELISDEQLIDELWFAWEGPAAAVVAGMAAWRMPDPVVVEKGMTLRERDCLRKVIQVLRALIDGLDDYDVSMNFLKGADADLTKALELLNSGQ